MPSEPQLTAQTLKVLEALQTKRDQSGSELSKVTGLKSGTLYPILLRLERAGWLSSEWEVGNPSELGRPRRRFYRITGEGARASAPKINEMHVLTGRLIWTPV